MTEETIKNNKEGAPPEFDGLDVVVAASNPVYDLDIDETILVDPDSESDPDGDIIVDHEIVFIDIVGASAASEDAGCQEIGGDIILVDIVGTSDGGAGRAAAGHEIGHGISIRQVGSTGTNDSFDFTAQPGTLEAPVPPGEIIIMPDADCPPDAASYDPIADLLIRHENVSEPRGDDNLAGGEIIMVDIVGSSCSDTDFLLT